MEISLGEEKSSKKKHHVQQSLKACSLPLSRKRQQQEARRAHGWMSNYGMVFNPCPQWS